MFLDFYRMREQPFGVTPDPRFLFLGQSHREALASLFYAIESDRGFLALIAHPGMGKTTLTFQLLEKLQQTARTVFLFQTQCNSRQLFQYILSDLGVDVSRMDKVSMHNKLNEILYQERLAGRRFILAIDEAQNLHPGTLETIRLLSNFETSKTKLLQILLIGQPELARTLADPALLQLEQRVAVFARLEPFDPADTTRYIAHRTNVAGYSGESLFTPGALRVIADRSQGIPRNINSLCFSALSIGCAIGRKQIDVDIMREVVADLNVESLYRHSHIAPLMPTSGVSVGERPAVTSLPSALPDRDSWTYAAFVQLADMPHVVTETAGRAFSYGTEVKNQLRRWVLAKARLVASKTVGDARLIYFSLLHLALRFFGQDNHKLIKQAQELYPTVTKANHIEIGQEIQPPKLSDTVNIPSVSKTNSMTAKHSGANGRP